MTFNTELSTKLPDYKLSLLRLVSHFSICLISSAYVPRPLAVTLDGVMNLLDLINHQNVVLGTISFFLVLGF